ncbi:MAG: DUF192 domain-containing protein [Gammaproteobacteria bacterium]|nr:DUF192 domain-containing protein [Gammaproteobacteria bacterium]MDE1887212.1 DUF192 domain-containing protein [Gammaproteobacteria bacterium]MDE2024197.1 DUF192 domain-containing protein [Gammaproteobacteria bacterium]MDE2274074.1 DUF192 domain-containing protein [Gammaproteobacteria bacterium]
MLKRTSLLLTLLIFTWLPAVAVRAALPVTQQVTLAGHRFTVEIANTDAMRERGLMFRTHMAANHGMLFVYSDAQPRYFWMKNTLIPLDIIFFDAHQRLINVSADTPPCKTEQCPTYTSAAPAQYVLELNAGMAKKLGLKPGERFTIR